MRVRRESAKGLSRRWELLKIAYYLYIVRRWRSYDGTKEECLRLFRSLNDH